MQWIWFTKNSRLSSNKSVLSVLMAHPSLTLPKFRRHQLIQLRIAWEFVDERHKGAADFQKPLPRTDICDIAHLQIGDVKELRKLNSVCGRLVQHDDELAVGKHRPRRMAL